MKNVTKRWRFQTSNFQECSSIHINWTNYVIWYPFTISSQCNTFRATFQVFRGKCWAVRNMHLIYSILQPVSSSKCEIHNMNNLHHCMKLILALFQQNCVSHKSDPILQKNILIIESKSGVMTLMNRNIIGVSKRAQSWYSGRYCSAQSRRLSF